MHRSEALFDLFGIDTNLTAAAAVSRIMPIRGADTLSHTYILQFGIARYVEGVDHGEHARYTAALSALRQAVGGFKRINALLLESITNRAYRSTLRAARASNAAANYQTQALKGPKRSVIPPSFSWRCPISHTHTDRWATTSEVNRRTGDAWNWSRAAMPIGNSRRLRAFTTVLAHPLRPCPPTRVYNGPKHWLHAQR